MTVNFSDKAFIEDDNSIFLAGPTLRNSLFADSWRKEACEILEELKFNGTVYIPEFSNGNNPFDFINQASWERQGLQTAGVIIFYIPRKLPELPGFTTNVEFGMWLARKPEQTLLCCPEGSEKNRYLIWLYNEEKPDSKVFTDLHSVIREALKMLKER